MRSAQPPSFPRARARRLAAAVAALACAFAVAPAAAQAGLFRLQGSFGQGIIANPAAITTDSAGRIFVVDSARHQVEVFDSAESGNGYLGSFGADDNLENPSGIVIDNRQRIYVADASRSVIVRYTPYTDEGGPQVARALSQRGQEIGQLSNPQHLAVDARPQIYVADRDNIRVQWILATGAAVAGFGVGDPPGFNAPHGLARDRHTGQLYVTNDEASSGRVRVFDPRGLLQREIAGPGSAPGQVAGPQGVALDEAGRALVADTGNGRIEAFDSFARGSGYLDQLGGLGAPSDVAVAPGAQVYVADAAHGRIVRLSWDDADSDGVIDALDDCRGLANPDQRDADRDGIGDACDPDIDNDGFPNAQDPCPSSVHGVDRNRDGCPDPTSRITVPSGKRYSRRGAPHRIAGTAFGADLGISRVDVAVARVVGHGRCRWYRRGGHFGRTTSCSSPAYIGAHGTTSWSTKVKIRRRGTYLIVSRAVQRGGAVEGRASKRNTRSIRLR